MVVGMMRVLQRYARRKSPRRSAAAARVRPQAGHGLRMIALITQSRGPRATRSGPSAASVPPSAAAAQSRPRGVAPVTTSQSSDAIHARARLILPEGAALCIRQLVRGD